MRRSSRLRGLRSLFSRAVRKVKAFFGFREKESEIVEEVAEKNREALAQQDNPEQYSDSVVESDSNDDDGDGTIGGGDDGGDGTPAYHRKKVEETVGKLREEQTKDVNTTKNYAVPVGMSPEEWEEQVRREREVRQQRIRLVKEQKKQEEQIAKERERLRLQRREMARQAVCKQREEVRPKTREEREAWLREALALGNEVTKEDGLEFC